MLLQGIFKNIPKCDDALEILIMAWLPAANAQINGPMKVIMDSSMVQ
jgi:hypothetical protein